MPTAKDPTQEVQAQVLDGIRKSQEAVIDGMRTWAETIQQLVPGTARDAGPRTDQLPTPAEVVDSVFDFAAQLLNAQRELAHSVLGATTAVDESGQKETEKAAGTAKKSTKR
jgi:methionyl-tRNA formyltransferase